MPVDARHADAVVANRSDCARDVRAVTVVVHRIGVAVGKVVAPHIVNVAVAIIVDAVSSHLTGIAPSIGSQIGMVVIDASVDHGDNHRSGTSGRVPRFGSIDVDVCHATRLADVVETPERAEGWIVGEDRGSNHEIGFNVRNALRACGPAEHILHAGMGRFERVKTFTQRSRLPTRGGIECRRREARRGGAYNPCVAAGLSGVPLPLDLP